MTWEDTTKVLLVLTAVVLILYDILAVNFGGPNASISRVMLSTAHKYPFVVLGLGFILGHMFWPN